MLRDPPRAALIGAIALMVVLVFLRLAGGWAVVGLLLMAVAVGSFFMLKEPRSEQFATVAAALTGIAGFLMVIFAFMFAFEIV